MEEKPHLSLSWEDKNRVLIGFDENELPIWGKYDDLVCKGFRERFSYGINEAHNTEDDFSKDNILVKGDNLLSLIKLRDSFTNRIKCIYIDPPFNTGKRFDHYADGLDRSTWLSMMKIRLEIMKDLLTEDGVIFVHIDDDEMPYLKILMDEIFRGQSKVCGKENNSENHIATIIWQKKLSPQNDAKFFSDVHDFVLVYAKNSKKLKINPIERTLLQNDRYTNRDNDPRGVWTSSDLTVKTPNPHWIYPITLPSGRVFMPSASRSWGFSKERFQELVQQNRIWFGNNGNCMPRLKKFLTEVRVGVVPKTIWFCDEVGDNSEGKREVKNYSDSNNTVFSTPKPERLLLRILQIATNEGDWVLDAFLGSGTTCAVAHKLNRRWIGLENGEHINEICVPRLKHVIDGNDHNKVTEILGWKGGGGFRFYEVEK